MDELLDAVLNGRYWLNGFHRKTYAKYFKEYYERYADIFAVSAAKDGFGTQFADALAEKLRKVRFWNRAGARTDAKMVLVAYLLPMLRGSENPACQTLCTDFCDRWNTNNPKEPLKAASYDTIVSGFRNRILSFEIKDKEPEKEK